MKNVHNNFKEIFCPWILNKFPPISLVYSSPNAQKILGKNFLSPSQFMRPFGNLKGTSLVFMFNEKYQSIVQDFQLDFYDTQDFVKIENNQMNNYIINCISSESVMPNCENNYIKLDKNDIQSFLSQFNNLSPKYYLEFEKLLFEMCQFQETELYQQPILNTYLCDIKDDVNIINYLTSQSMPKLISSEAYEQKTIDLLILLNDKSDLSNKNLNKLVLETNFKNKYDRIEVITIDINSGCLKENQKDLSDDIWSDYIHKIEEFSDGFDPIKRGRYITKTEINNFKQKFSYYIKNRFRPNLLGLITKLNLNLTKNSGINLFINRFKSAKIERQEYIKEYKLAKLLSADRQRYFLSILLFHIRDYTDAYENLKKLKDSLKGKNKEYENSINQLKIICRYMKKEDKSQIDTLAPLQTYLDNKQYLLAYRNILLYLRMTEQLKVESILDNIYKYNNLLTNHYIKYLSGLLFEKIGFYYLASKNPKPRQFALNILNHTIQQYSLEKENDIKNYYVIQNLFYMLEQFKIDYDYSLLDDYENLSSFYFIKKYIFKLLCSSCEMTNNIKLGLPLLYNYLRFLLCESSSIIKKSINLFDFNNDNDENEEINFFFQKLNSILIKGKIKYLENFPLPIINDDSFVYYKEEDQNFFKNYNKCNFNFMNSFKKYTELSVEQKYSSLSEEDLSTLRYIDEQLSLNFTSNYFMKRKVNVKIGEQIFIKINIKNPLNINLSIKNMTLIINREPCINKENSMDYECGFFNIDIPPNQTIAASMKIIFNTVGVYEICGIAMTLFKNINIKYLFNKKKINFLYLHSKKFKNNIISNSIKKNFTFKVISPIEEKSVIINNNNEKCTLFQNQIYFIPIKILNNNNPIEIKNFTIFFDTNDDIIIYPKYLDNNYLNNNNLIYVPIVGKEAGECLLKIIIKYKEKILNSDLDLYRNIIMIKVIKGANINIQDKIYEYDEINYKRQITLNLDLINQIDYHSISYNEDKSLIFDRTKFFIEEEDNQNLNGKEELQDKNINRNLIFKISNNKNNNCVIYDNLFEDIIEKKDLQNYEQIKNFLTNVFCGENNLIINYRLNILENNKIHGINCIYSHEIKINDLPLNKMLHIDKAYLKNILIKCFDINYEVEDLNDGIKCIHINIKMINFLEYFEKRKHIIEYIEIKVNNDNNFDWIGISSTFYNDLNSIKDKEEIIKSFDCLIDERNYSLSDKNGAINLNQFIFSVKIMNSNIIYQFTEFPYNIYYSLN